MSREDDLHGRGTSTCLCTAYCAKGAEHLGLKMRIGSLSLQRDSYSLQKTCETRCWSDNKITKITIATRIATSSPNPLAGYLRYRYHIPLIQCIYLTVLSSSPHASPSRLAPLSLFLFRPSFACLSPQRLVPRLREISSGR
jgi:hypothetical protein